MQYSLQSQERLVKYLLWLSSTLEMIVENCTTCTVFNEKGQPDSRQKYCACLAHAIKFGFYGDVR